MIQTTPSFSPTCPNHSVNLEGCGFPLPAQGVGTCPVSGAQFEFAVELDDAKITMDKQGNAQKSAQWRITGDEV